MSPSLLPPPPPAAPGLHVGDLNVDILLHLPRWPRPGEELHLEGLSWSPGGSATNAAVLMARWGHPTRLVARLGRDRWGHEVKNVLAALPGLDLSGLQEDHEHPTGTVFVLVDPSGERTFLTQRGANAFLKVPHPEAFFHPLPAYLHGTGFNALAPAQRAATEALMTVARRQGVPIVLDVGIYPAQHARDVLKSWLAHVTMLSLTYDEAQELLQKEEAPEALLETLAETIPVVALRMGRQGAWLAWMGQKVRLPPLPVAPVDTTGAGDAFTAGLLLGWRWGLSGEATGWLAHLLGALATTVVGAGPVLPGPEVLQTHWPALEDHVPKSVRLEMQTHLKLK